MLDVADGVVHARMDVREKHLAPNGYLHAGAVVGLADTACGYGWILSLPDGAHRVHHDRAEDELPPHAR